MSGPKQREGMSLQESVPSHQGKEGQVRKLGVSTQAGEWGIHTGRVLALH